MNPHQRIDLTIALIDYPGPDFLKQAAIQAIQNGHNEYSREKGNLRLRQAVADKMQSFYDFALDPDSEIIITHGATEGVFASVMSLVQPGDEVILVEPCYEWYLPIVKMAGGIPKIFTLEAPTWTLDAESLGALFTERTRMIILNNPHNPTGHVFSDEERGLIADLCEKYDVIAVSDEVYEHLTYDGRYHAPLAAYPGMRERTITISNITKTFGMTGWKLGWAIAGPEIIRRIRAVHRLALGSCNAPIQEAAITAVQTPRNLYEQYTKDYQRKRDILMQALHKADLNPILPQGGSFIISDISHLGFNDEALFCKQLLDKTGIAAKPAGVQYLQDDYRTTPVRWAFCKQEQTLVEAASRLENMDLS